MTSDLQRHYEKHGQGQVFRFWDELGPAERAALESEAAAVDLEEVARLREIVARDPRDADTPAPGEIFPADWLPLPRSGGDPALWREAREAGEAALRAGRVAAFTVAGGQGTRLGFEGPKGTFPVTPVRRASLFQVFAEKILAASDRYGKPVPWFIMTSVINHQETVDYFARRGHFGLDPDRITFFSQGLMPAVDDEGKILLAEKGRLALSPDGHGGSLRALCRSGAIRRLEADGVDLISYFQVDNPLVRCLDPELIGFHVLEGSEMSSKAVEKTAPEERVGVFCSDAEGRSRVIEYSDLPEALAAEREPGGRLRFRAGSIAIHVFDREFVARMGGEGGGQDGVAAALPFHLARKAVPHVGPDGERIQPAAPNAWKFEMFVFDALPFARNPVIAETAREEEFSPVKNAEGADSPQACRDDQLRQFARWARSAGLEVETDATGLPAAAFEVTPAFADSEEAFSRAVAALPEPPALVEGAVLGA